VFIPLAEESGLIIPLEKCVIHEVCRQLDNWQKIGKRIERVSINISVVSLFQEDFVDYITETLRHYNLEDNLLELEITERNVMKNEEHVNRNLQALRKIGIKISIDDFGTGYSSLSYLHKLHVDILKIDQSFIQHIEQNREVVSAIISMAKSLELTVIAEGVETKEQLEVLKQLGCEEVQGYYFSEPIPCDVFETSLIDVNDTKRYAETGNILATQH
jgi:EAL domain-containing protein (putative c-di-GMP-specific phosphodiesterase class I)